MYRIFKVTLLACVCLLLAITIVQANFGNTTASIVPETTRIIFFGLGMGTLVFKKKKKPTSRASIRNLIKGGSLTNINKMLFIWAFLTSLCMLHHVAFADEGSSGLQITAQAGWDIFDRENPPEGQTGSYRYGASIIINDDNSIDWWAAGPGLYPGYEEWDWIRYRHSVDGGKTWGTEKVVLRPTPGSLDAYSVCDPGVVKFGGYYYLGYTSTTSASGVENDVFVARSQSPTGPFDKWNGSGWGGNPQPFIEYDGSAGGWGAGEPSFVVKDETLYIYYTWNSAETRVATVSASDTNWPGNITHHGVALTRGSGEDSTDVKYIDAYGKFIGISTANRFSAESSIKVWESKDGLTFTSAGKVEGIAVQDWAHNAGISGTANGHIDLEDDNFIAYAYSPSNSNVPWAYWNTHLNPVEISEPTAHYIFKETAPGKWEVLVEVTGNGTAGLSAYEIWVDGVNPTTVCFTENVLATVVGAGYNPVGFMSLLQGDVGGSFNAGNFQNSGDAAIEGIGMTAIYEEGSFPGVTPLVDLDVPALLGILSTPAGLTEENFRVMVVGLLEATGDGFLSNPPIPTLEVIPFTLLPGDANHDGVVSAADYASVQTNFGNTGDGILGDANGDGVVSASDYASVQANFGNTSGTIVPEPATMILLEISGIVVLRRKQN